MIAEVIIPDCPTDTAREMLRHADAVALHQDMRRRCPCPEAQDDFVLSLALKACVRPAEYGYGRLLHCNAVKVGGADGFMARNGRQGGW